MQTFSRIIRSVTAGVATLLPTSTMAQLYNGGGVGAGVSAANNLGLASGNPFQVFLGVIRTILTYMGLVAVCTIVIAGIYMIISLGNDEQYEKGKKIIKYTLIGLIVILFSRMIVGLVTNYLYSVAR